MVNARLTKEEWEAVQRMRGLRKKITMKEAAEMLGTTVLDMRYRVRAGELGSAVKKGKRFEYEIYEDEVERMLK